MSENFKIFYSLRRTPLQESKIASIDITIIIFFCRIIIRLSVGIDTLAYFFVNYCRL